MCEMYTCNVDVWGGAVNWYSFGYGSALCCNGFRAALFGKCPTNGSNQHIDSVLPQNNLIFIKQFIEKVL